MKKFSFENPESGGVTTGAIIMLISLITGAIPYVFEWDMMQWGYGTVTLSGFFFIMGLVTYIIYSKRYAELSKLLEGTELLAHWHYDTESYLKKVEKTFKETKAMNLAIYKIILFFFVFFTILFLVFGFDSYDYDSAGAFVGMMVAILGLISMVAYFAPIVQRRRALQSAPEALIGKNGMLYLGQLYTWGSRLFILHNVEISKNNKELIFVIKYFTRVGWYKYETKIVTVEIPKGKLNEAKGVINKLRE